MEVRIKKGAGLRCEYTGDECEALIKIGVPDEREVLEETMWLGRRALEDALNMLMSALGPSAQGSGPQMTNRLSAGRGLPPPALLNEDDVQPIAQTPVNTGVRDPRGLVMEFENAVADLVSNPPQDEVGKRGGISELHIREIVGRFKGKFGNAEQSMYPVLQKHLGIPLERFRVMMTMV